MRTRLIMGAVILALIIFIIVAGPAACNRIRALQDQARVDKGQAGASISAGEEAINTIAGQAARDAETDREVKNAIDQINAAPAGDSNDAAIRAVCGMRSYRDTRQCARLRATDPEPDAGKDTSS